MPTTPETKSEVNTLEAVANETRHKARRILRLRAINEILKDVQSIKNEINEKNKIIERVNKAVTLVEYKLSKLDANDPDFESKLTELTKLQEYEKDLAEDQTAIAGVDIRRCQRRLAELDKKIADIESGKTLMMNDDITDLAKELLLMEPLAK